MKKMIPTNLGECFTALKQELLPEDISFIQQHEDNVISLHHSLGRYLRNNWGLWGDGSELKSYFQKLGLFHPDDMSSIILRSFHRHLNDKPLEIEQQIKKYHDYWNAMTTGEIKQYKWYEWTDTCHCGKKIILSKDKEFHTCECGRRFFIGPNFIIRCVAGSQIYWVGGCTCTPEGEE